MIQKLIGIAFRIAGLTLLVVGFAKGALAQAGAVENCPNAETSKVGFFIERGDQQKSEVIRDNSMVRSTMRYRGEPLLETTLYEGLFELDRVDRGSKTKFEAQGDLQHLFPLKVGRAVRARFSVESNGRHDTLSVEMAVRGTEAMYIGGCKYDVLKIDLSESHNAAPLRFAYTEYYSPELKFVLGKEYRESKGTRLVKYDRIYPLGR